ncbi:MAG: aminotransferase DegT [Colwellia sp. Phe_37]|nr:MAG: aminotransferase DegT [Colwellia sp. Phe_37]
MTKFIPISEPSITSKEIEYVTDAIQSGWVSSLGRYIDKFESEFAKFCNVKFALTTSNGTTALHLALVSLGIKEGDEVIIPDLTFVATANAVKYCGANPVMADVEKDTLCLNPLQIRELITDRTKAIIPVHLYGHPANMVEIVRIADEYGLDVVEDAAEAHGAGIGGRKVGGFGACGVFSFYGNKIMTCGEGGMITTNNPSLYNRAKYLRDHAMSEEKRYWHDEVGFNYRMTNLQAALGLAQLERIEEIINKKRKIFSWYLRELGGVEGVELNYTREGVSNVYWMICVQVEGLSEGGRGVLLRKLKEKGVDARPFFYPISDLPMYEETNTPVTHSVYKSGVNLPSFFAMQEADVIYVTNVFMKILKEIN